MSDIAYLDAHKVFWLYIDLNSYFASVEQHLNPRLRGKPVAVVPMITDTTCVIAASYEAKKFGIKTGTMVSDAKRLCPKLILLTGKHEEYIRYHHKIVTAVESSHPVTGIMSIDEVACALGGRDQNVINAIALAKEIKQKIYAVGESFGCSIGLGPNRFLAKVASDMQKPNGLTVITRADLPQKLLHLKLQDLIGIGPRMEKRLHAHGIYTVEKLYQSSLADLRKVWGGIGGERFYKWLRGENLEVEYDINKTIGHSHVLPPHERTMTGAFNVLNKLINKAAVRLRKIQSWTKRVSISVRYVDRSSWSADVKLLECQDTFTLQEALSLMWQGARPGTPLKVGVTLSDFVHERERNLSFFSHDRRETVSRTMDALNTRFGKNTVYLGSIAHSLESAPLRISFTSIPEVDI
jgi:DNA polymerase-4